MERARRAIAASVAALLTVAVVLPRRAGEGPRFVDAPGDWALLTADRALTGALVLPRYLAPRARHWLWPVLGGLLLAFVTMTLILAPGAVWRVASGRYSATGAALTLVAAGFYAALMAGSICIAGALAVHRWFWAAFRGDDAHRETAQRDPRRLR